MNRVINECRGYLREQGKGTKDDMRKRPETF